MWVCGCYKDTCGYHFRGRGNAGVIRLWGVDFDSRMAYMSMSWGSGLRAYDIARWHIMGVLVRHCKEVMKDKLPKAI